MLLNCPGGLEVGGLAVGGWAWGGTEAVIDWMGEWLVWFGPVSFVLGLDLAGREDDPVLVGLGLGCLVVCVLVPPRPPSNVNSQ